MIVVDTSALMAIVGSEPRAAACKAALAAEPKVLISAGTFTEALVVAGGRNVAGDMEQLVEAIGMEVVPVTAASARRAALAYQRWGRGRHAAALNFGDCFAYELAKENGCGLLFVGEAFSRTDIESVL